MTDTSLIYIGLVPIAMSFISVGGYMYGYISKRGWLLLSFTGFCLLLVGLFTLFVGYP